MSRMPSLARDELSLKDQKIYDDIAAKRGSVYGPFPVLLNSPQVAGRTAKLGEYLRYETSLEPKVLQLVTLTVAREWDCQCQWTDHEPQALEAGVPESTINALKERRAPEGLAADEAELVSFVQELIQYHRVSETTFAHIKDRLGSLGLTDLTATIGYYSLLACVLNGFEIPPAFGRVPLLPT